MSATVKMKVHFTAGQCGHRVLRKGRKPKHAKSTRLPRITRLMALSIKYEHLIQKGLVKTHRELAALADTDRSHVSFIVSLRLLTPDIQEWLLNLPETKEGKDPIGWKEARRLSSIVSWKEQRRELRKILGVGWP
ncbi:hypothetical protein P4B35_10115 [Pontiellaceae bacterium B12227]|nr:hypothetical protein [Pontiellaceae bacterium B12227]